jgi:hypothetical protein
MNSHDPSIEEIIRRAREAGAADLHLQRPAFTRQSPAVTKDTPRQQLLRNFSSEKWHWCLGFTLCHSLVGFILLLCSVNPYGISSSMLAPGIMYAVCMLLPANRRQPLDNLAMTYFGYGCLTLFFALISIVS